MSRSQPLLRCEIRKMLRVDQERFCAAVETMMRLNAHGDPRSSEYFRVAGYHGWPGNYCNHGIESFPAWHRAYLVEFESALQAADRANGYDGNISLPYWDWTDTDQPEMFPAIIRQKFPQLNSDLFPDNNELKQKGYLINSDQYIRLMILGAALSQQCNEAVAHPQHFQAASHEYTQGYSLEDPHDSIHVYCGYPMSVVQFAAFHPIFFLHHCNLDRLYETHLATNPHAQAEFQSHEWSRLLRDIGAANVLRAKSCLTPLELPKLNDMNRPKTLYELPLIPFKHPVTGLDMMPKDCFDTISLGYAYDRLTAIPPQQLQAPPTWAVFRGVDVAGKLANVSYTVFVFVVRKYFEQQWTPPQPKLEALLQSHNLAGITAIFGAKGEGCDNCMKRRKPITLKVNISQALSDQGISRHQAGLRVIAMDHHHQFFLLESTAIPQPMIEGPYFSHSWLLLRQGALPGVPEAVLEGEVLQLQKFLKKHGYYDHPLDGRYSSSTCMAVMKLQRMLGITVDGMAGPETKGQMLCARHDSNEADVNFGLMSDDEGKAVYQMGQVVRWWCGPAPSYLSQSQVQKELEAAFSQWAEAVPLHFLQTDHPQNCDLALSWADHSPDHEFKFSGPGSTLAVTENRCITFDLSEMWLLQGQRPRIHPSGGHLYPSFYFLPVLLHELGHALGLRHSELPGDVMAPYYHAGKVKLSRNDLGRSLLLYPLHRISSLAFKALDPGPGGLVSKQDMKQVLMQRGMEPLSEIEFELLWKRVQNGSGLTHSHFAAISHQQFVLLLSGLFTSSSFR